MTDYKNYTVTFTADGYPDVVALLDATPSQVTGGHGGWTTTARQRRIALTQWQGNDPIRLAVPILFDDAINRDHNQTIAMKTLAQMALPPDGGGEPPIVHVDGPGAMIQAAVGKHIKNGWVIENLQWGTNVRRERVVDGLGKIRQDVVVNLLEYIHEDRLKLSSHGWPKWYHTKPGDTLPKIAAHFYHNSKKWHRIAKANGLRDAKPPHMPDILEIPAP